MKCYFTPTSCPYMVMKCYLNYNYRLIIICKCQLPQVADTPVIRARGVVGGQSAVPVHDF